MVTMRLKPKNGSITLSKAEINEFNRRIKEGEAKLKEETTSIAILLVLAYLMEETEFNDADKLVSMYTKLNDWADSISDHLISVKNIAAIIEENTGLEIKWKDD